MPKSKSSSTRQKPLISKAVIDVLNTTRKTKRSRRAKANRSSMLSMSNSLNSSYANVAEDVELDYMEPTIGTGAGGGRLVSNRELVLPTVSFGAGTGFFITNQFNFNPGLASLVPWLSNIAIDFTSYKLHRFNIVYIPITGTSTQGDSVMFPAYNPLAQAPTTETAVVNNKDSVTRVVWKSWRKRLNPLDLMGGMARKFVRTGNIAGDLKTYDATRIYIGSNNAVDSSAKPIGKYFIEYDVEFFDPVVQSNTALQPSSTTQYYNNVADTLSNGVNTVISLSLATGLNGLNLPDPSSGQIFLPAGVYRITANFTYTDNTAETFAVTQALYYSGAVLPNTRGISFFSLYAGAVNAPAGSCNSDILLSVSQSDVSANINYLTLTAQALGAAGVLQCRVGGSLIIQPA